MAVNWNKPELPTISPQTTPRVVCCNTESLYIMWHFVWLHIGGIGVAMYVGSTTMILVGEMMHDSGQ